MKQKARLQFSTDVAITTLEETNLRHIVTSHCKRKMGVDVTVVVEREHTSMTEAGGIVHLFYPVYSNSFVMVTESEARALHLDLDRFVGLGFISDNPLMYVASLKVDVPGITFINNMSFYILNGGNPGVEASVTMLQDSIEQLASQGMVVLDSDREELCMELCQVWEMDCEDITVPVFETDGDYGAELVAHQYLVIQSRDVHGCILERWITDTLDRIENDQSPLVNIGVGRLLTERSQEPWDGDVDSLFDSVMKAFEVVVSLNPSLLPFVDDVSVLPDGSVSLPLYSIEDFNTFVNIVGRAREASQALPSPQYPSLKGGEIRTDPFLSTITFDGENGYVLVTVEEPDSSRTDELDKLIREMWDAGMFSTRWGTFMMFKGLETSFHVRYPLSFRTTAEAIDFLSSS